MKTLKTQIEESLFDSKTDNDIVKGAQRQAVLDLLKSYSDSDQEDSIWNTQVKASPAIATPKGIEIQVVQSARNYLCLSDIHSKNSPKFNICKAFGDRNVGPASGLIVYIIDSDIESLGGIFTPNCKFDDCEITIQSCPNLTSLNGLPRKMKGVTLNLSIKPSNILGNNVNKMVYKSENEFFEPWKKFIQSIPECDKLNIRGIFEDFYPLEVRRKLTIGGKKPKKTEIISRLKQVVEGEIKKVTRNGKFSLYV